MRPLFIAAISCYSTFLCRADSDTSSALREVLSKVASPPHRSDDTFARLTGDNNVMLNDAVLPSRHLNSIDPMGRKSVETSIVRLGPPDTKTSGMTPVDPFIQNKNEIDRLSKDHARLATVFDGALGSSRGVEVILENKREDKRYVMISGLGLNINSTLPPSPCRVKIYTKLVKMFPVPNGINRYQLALDTSAVRCMGQGEETVVTSEVFLSNYQKIWAGHNGEAVEDAIDGTRKLKLDFDRYGVEGDAKGTTFRENDYMPYDEHDQAEDHDYAGAFAGDGNIIPCDQENQFPPNDANNVTSAIDPSEPVQNSRIVPNTTSSRFLLTSLPDDSNSPAVPVDTEYPLLIPPDSSVSFYIVVLPVGNASGGAEGTPSNLLDSPKLLFGEGTTDYAPYTSDSSLTLYEGSSILNGSMVDVNSSDSAPGETLDLVQPTVFHGAFYYDVLAHNETVDDYYDSLEYSLIREDAFHGVSGCDYAMTTGYIDSVGSFGLMFDVTSNAKISDGQHESQNEYMNVTIYGMDVYIRNIVNTSIEVYVRVGGNSDGGNYISYAEKKGQTLISDNWELIAKGNITGRGPFVGTPISPEAWIKNIVIEPGQSVGFYVTVTGAPDLRYRESSLEEGTSFASDEILSVGVGRAWGEYPLMGDGSDVFFEPREFSGTFYYHTHGDICSSSSPSIAPSPSPAPSASAFPATAENCTENKLLSTTFQDGTGSHGSLFDILAERDVTLTGLDLNVDWESGNEASVLIYARKGSWFGFQNERAAWPHLLTNATIYRPENFHNRTLDGPYIPLEKKVSSAVITESNFIPLSIKMGETWAIYICMSLADMRYTVGTSIGKTFASNPEMKILEGAGAADFPPFGSRQTGNGEVEYTFYAPRVFNGNLRYSYASDCNVKAPSAQETLGPSMVSKLVTSVGYSFYVEHDLNREESDVRNAMEQGIKSAVMGWLDDSSNILSTYVLNDGLSVVTVSANVISPTQVGYLCIPKVPNTCTPVVVEVKVNHFSSLSSDDATYALLYQATFLPSIINAEGLTLEYIGNRAVVTNSIITISGVPFREMERNEILFFENVARSFLNNRLAKSVSSLWGSGGEGVRVLAVSIDRQNITSDEPSLETAEIEGITPGKNSIRRLKNSNNVRVSIKGEYIPPPEIDFGKVIEDSINAEREALTEELAKPPIFYDGSGFQKPDTNYFANAEIVGAREVKEFTNVTNPGLEQDVAAGTEAKTNENLEVAAIVVAALIFLLCITFFSRPHRMAAICSSRQKVSQSHPTTQEVDPGDSNCLQPSSRFGLSFTSSAGSRSLFPGSFTHGVRNSRNGKLFGLDLSAASISSATNSNMNGAYRTRSFQTNDNVHMSNESTNSFSHAEQMNSSNSYIIGHQHESEMSLSSSTGRANGIESGSGFSCQGGNAGVESSDGFRRSWYPVNSTDAMHRSFSHNNAANVAWENSVHSSIASMNLFSGDSIASRLAAPTTIRHSLQRSIHQSMQAPVSSEPSQFGPMEEARRNQSIRQSGHMNRPTQIHSIHEIRRAHGLLS